MKRNMQIAAIFFALVSLFLSPALMAQEAAADSKATESQGTAAEEKPAPSAQNKSVTYDWNQGPESLQKFNLIPSCDLNFFHSQNLCEANPVLACWCGYNCLSC